MKYKEYKKSNNRREDKIMCKNEEVKRREKLSHMSKDQPQYQIPFLARQTVILKEP